MKSNKEKAKEKTQISLSGILGNNRVLMILSVVIAFGLWVWVAIEKSPESETVITDVPVHIDLQNTIPQQLGLEIFGNQDYKVDVTVKGKKYVLSALTKEDISVTANVNYVDSPGVKTLRLTVNPVSDNDDFIISSSSTTYIEVFFDVRKEVEMALESDIVHSIENIVSADCLLGDPVLSKGTVIVSGPATEINRITSVKASVTIENTLTNTTTFDPIINLVTSDASQLDYCTVNTGDTDITMTVPVLKMVTLPTSVDFKNAPAQLVANPINYTVTPSSITAAIPVEAIETTKSFVVSTIDFADITNSVNTFNVKADDITSFRITDSSVKNFRIRVDASDYEEKTVTLPASSVYVKNNREDFNVNLDQVRDVTVTLIGPASELNEITAEDISIELDTADKSITANTASLEGRVIINKGTHCWAVGKYDIKIKAVPTA